MMIIRKNKTYTMQIFLKGQAFSLNQRSASVEKNAVAVK